MLNISENSVHSKLASYQFQTFEHCLSTDNGQRLRRFLFIISALLTAAMFLPWTQNISGKGAITALFPEQRPQTVHTVIAGRIEKWYVTEGQLVQEGDTIIRISEVRNDFFDPNLLKNISEQIVNKEQSAKAYMGKVEALNRQIDALNHNFTVRTDQQMVKLDQLRLKIQSDSIGVVAALTGLQVADQQYHRALDLYGQGLKSKTELEQRELARQQAEAALVEARNKLQISRNEFINVESEINALRADFRDKISKAESEKFASLSAYYDTEAQVTRLQNQFAGNIVRADYYAVTAPVSGYITRAIRAGVGEMLKEGDEVVSLMPEVHELAVELYVEPMDLPLVQLNQKVRFIFDGWPVFFFSGWPGVSFGTYGGRIVAIDQFISENGRYRLLVARDAEDVPWPKGLRVGAGARGFMLLNDVPIWYELWRQFNGFPPDFYSPNPTTTKVN